MFNLAVAYSRGDGTGVDFTEAVKWYQRAADMGHTMAAWYVWTCLCLKATLGTDHKQRYQLWDGKYAYCDSLAWQFGKFDEIYDQSYATRSVGHLGNAVHIFSAQHMCL